MRYRPRLRVDRAARPVLNPLEDRSLLTLFTVTSPFDSGAGTLRAVLAQADASPGPDVIRFAPGVVGVALTTDRLVLRSDVTISGPPGGVTVLRGAGAPGGLFQVETGVAATLENLTITGGRADNGAGIYNRAGNLTLKSCTVRDNLATGFGGGVYNLRGPAGETANLTVVSGIFSGNVGGLGGGGIGNDFGQVAIKATTFDHNQGNGMYGALGGGGIYTKSGRVVVSDSTFWSNSGIQGGGVLSEAGVLDFTGCTFSANRDIYNGGAIYAGGGNFPVRSCTFAPGDNIRLGPMVGGYMRVDGSNGGPRVDFASAGGSGPLIQNSIISGIDGPYTGSGNLYGFQADLGPLQDNGGPTWTHAPGPGGRAINGGVNALAFDANGAPILYDQRGAPRIVNGVIDVGAVETSYNAVRQVGSAGGDAASDEETSHLVVVSPDGVAPTDARPNSPPAKPVQVARPTAARPRNAAYAPGAIVVEGDARARVGALRPAPDEEESSLPHGNFRFLGDS